MNCAFLGLRMITDDLKASASRVDRERYNVLFDVSMSTGAAIDILNDLLCFDKVRSSCWSYLRAWTSTAIRASSLSDPSTLQVESDIAELRKTDVPVLSFLTESVAMFYMQSREQGVTLSLLVDSELYDMPAGSSESSSSQEGPAAAGGAPGMRGPISALRLTDIMEVDKFKMAQVSPAQLVCRPQFGFRNQHHSPPDPRPTPSPHRHTGTPAHRHTGTLAPWRLNKR